MFEILINSNYVGEKIELSNSKLYNKKIGSLNLDYGNIYLEENDIFLKENLVLKFLIKTSFIENFWYQKKIKKTYKKFILD